MTTDPVSVPRWAWAPSRCVRCEQRRHPRSAAPVGRAWRADYVCPSCTSEWWVLRRVGAPTRRGGWCPGVVVVARKNVYTARPRGLSPKITAHRPIPPGVQ